LKVIVSLIVVLLGIICFIFAGPTINLAFNTSSANHVSGPAAASAKEIYMQNCARCHGADGRGKTALGKTFKSPDLTISIIQKRNDQRLTRSIAKGRGNMPAFGKKLSKEEITALIGYVRSLKK
jgi:mono/diheme cytochrome c family protein